MNIEIFQKNFQIRDINLRPYIIVVSIFIIIMLVISFFYNKLEDYYICSGIVIDDNVSLIVNKEELNNIIDNNKTMIERNIFTYKVLKINELEDINSSFNEVILEFDKIPKHLFINNNIINMKIITNKTTFFEYLIKIAKGE